MKSLIATVSIAFVFLIVLSACGDLDILHKTAKITAEDIIPQITSDSKQWRDLLEKISGELPDEIRQQVDDAFNRAIIAAEKAGFCGVDFFRDRLIEDLRRIIPNQQLTPGKPIVCHTDPASGVVDLDSNARPKYKWIKFTGYNLDNRKVHVYLVSVDGGKEDITNTGVTSPTHYDIVIDFDRVKFTKNQIKFTVYWDGIDEEKSVAINMQDVVWPKAYSISSHTPSPGGDYGGGGGQPFTLSCPPNNLVTGFVIRKWEYVDNVKLICSDLETDGNISNNKITKGYGGQGGTEYVIACPPKTAVFKVDGRALSVVDNISKIYCTNIMFDPASVKEVNSPTGGQGGSDFESSCSNRTILTGIEGRSGTLVDHIKFICSEIDEKER